MKKVVVMIDGGHLRVVARKAGLSYKPAFIKDFDKRCLIEGEELLKVLYYDCSPFNGSVKLPIWNDEIIRGF